MTGTFEKALNRELDILAVAPAVREQVWAQRSKLAAAETGDPRGHEAIGEAFVAGYRAVLWAGGSASARQLRERGRTDLDREAATA